MANQHKHRQRVVRGIPDEEAEAFDTAARRGGSDRSAITRQLWAWYSQQPGAELPERPDPPRT
ncbi:hypothetical protein [Streptomyces europaeiscabiei]|uniref:hypothetical protein n=1 Tax=Streptomyces europaeiscabiei TaxID=146819 RepID=UPI0029A35A64|nr:hypothetical protein [Streptomyces europaeiscabiei]MDX2757940.1 hypothetical protein [Streptomyces europaeiscabiei]